MVFKAGVNPVGVQAPTWYAVGVAEVCYRNQGVALRVTSLTDSIHPDLKNIHGNGFAADLGIRGMTSQTVAKIVEEMKYHLYSLGYDVVLETDHIHVEYDPKPGRSNWQSYEV